MASITLKGNPISTSGELPAVGSAAPDFVLTTTDLRNVSLSDFPGTRLLNIFPSIDTPVCATSVRSFNKEAGSKENVTVLNISADLPFAHGRFCGAEGIDKAVSVSTFRGSFLDDYGIKMADGPLAGVAARAVMVVDAEGVVKYVELVPEIAQEPDYAAALAALG
ncbi:MAG: thiol peroxidase [Myxococcota bacterium]